MITKEIDYDGLHFVVDENGVLQLMSQIEQRLTAHIPHRFPDGTEIHSIASGFCSGGYYKIEISDEISNIEDGAFRHSQVVHVVWPKGCTKIPDGCFEFSKIQLITDIDEVEVVGNGAFNNSSLIKITWPSKCKVIPELCFSNVFSLGEISNISHVEIINYGAFACSGIKEFDWPSACKTIPASCFEGSYLEEITNINGVTEAGEDAFANCAFKSFTIPKNLKTIPFGFLRDMLTLNKIDCHDDVSEIGECAFSKAAITNFKWPSRCNVIPKACFAGCVCLKELYNTSGVLKIEPGAFHFCRSFTQFNWPENCKTVPDFCFAESGLREISSLEHIESIGKEAFSGAKVRCLDLSTSPTQSIGDCAFCGLDKKNVKLPYYMDVDDCEHLFAEM